MGRISNIIISILNICALILSLIAIGASIHFHIHSSTECQNTIKIPILILGISLFVVSLLGLIGSCAKINWVLYIYLALMFLIIVGIVFLTAFVFLVTNENAGRVVSGGGYRKFRIADFSHWLQKKFNDWESWERIKSCLVYVDVCKGLKGDKSLNASELYKKLNLVQSGCCKPARYCGYEFQNATFWTVPKSGLASQDPDCSTYSNDPKKLCYDCQSCKSGLLASIRREWRTAAIVNSCIVIFLIIVYSVGCCAKRNNRSARQKYLFNPY